MFTNFTLHFKGANLNQLFNFVPNYKQDKIDKCENLEGFYEKDKNKVIFSNNGFP